MTVPRIYTAQPLQAGASLILDSGPARHVAGALRLKPGSRVTLFNGRGGEYDATLTAVERKQVQLQVGEHHSLERESPLSLHLGIALSRGERMDWVVQKSTELGVAEITPLDSERAGVRLQGERAAKKLGHWQRIAVSACEQCGRNSLPRINPIQGVPDWVQRVEADLKLVLHHRSESHLAGMTQPQSVALLIGPEGGLSDEEITRAQGSGFHALTLGPRIMRTETAPAAAIAILQAHWGDMK